MKDLGFIKKINIDECKNPYFRTAVRAIIFKDNLIYLLKSKKYGEYKFPGGGVENDESLIDALNREVYEEAGLIINNINEYGKVVEIRRAKDNNHDAFIVNNYYFIAEIEEETNYRNMDPYEIEFGYELEKVPVDEAIENNLKINNIEEVQWNERETLVLKYISSKIEETKNVNKF